MSDGARGMCVVPAGEAFLAAVRCLTEPNADCDVPESEPCYVRRHCYAVAVALELLAMMGRWPGGAERLEEMRARWIAEPEASAARLRELMMQPILASSDSDDQPWPGLYL